LRWCGLRKSGTGGVSEDVGESTKIVCDCFDQIKREEKTKTFTGIFGILDFRFLFSLLRNGE
jgi:hypothetical protein